MFNNSENDDFLSESRQKIALRQTDDFEERRLQIERSRNGFIGTLAGIALAAVVSWFVLLPRLSNQDETEIPVIRRLATPAKIQPTEPGGMDIPNQDKSVYRLVEKKNGTDVKTESLLPQPEVPQMPTIAPAEQPEPTPKVDEAETNKDLLEVNPLNEKIESVQASNGQKINIPEKPQDISSEVKTAPEANPSVQPKPLSKQKKTMEEKAKYKSAEAKTWQIQLMASTNKDAVEKAWTGQVKKYDVLAKLSHEVETVATGAQTIYRLKAGNFKERKDADDLCSKIKAAAGSCVVKQK